LRGSGGQPNKKRRSAETLASAAHVAPCDDLAIPSVNKWYKKIIIIYYPRLIGFASVTVSLMSGAHSLDGHILKLSSS